MEDAVTNKPALIIGNEFACVSVSIDEHGHDPRLMIEDLDTGATVWLDALILASLAREKVENLVRHLMPGEPEESGGA